MFRRTTEDPGFRDRADAGRRLAARLVAEDLQGDLIVLGLPRGGVPLAFEVALALDAPLDVIIVRKLGAPFNPELAVGGIALGGITAYNERLLADLGLDAAALEPIRKRETAELKRRERAYRGDRGPPPIAGRTAILVDDGVATGATMVAAVTAVRQMDPAELIVAVPTCSVEASHRLRKVADRVIALSMPEPYIAVGAWYQFFDQVSDAEVVDFLARHSHRSTPVETKRNAEPNS